MQRYPDVRRLWFVAVCASAVLLAAIAFSVSGRVSGGIWLGVGALASALAMIGVVARLRSASQDWLRELRHARSELRAVESRANLRERSLENMADGLDAPAFVCSKDGSIRWANRSAKRFFNYEGMSGRTLLEVSLSVELQRLATEASTTTAIVRDEIVLRQPTDRTVTAKAYRAEHDPETVFVIAEDVTELRRLERVRSDFVANASHEIRTPLAAIRSMAETIQADAELPEETKDRFLRKIVFEVDRLTELSNDLLVLSSAESNPIEPEEVDLADVVRHVYGQMEPRLAAKGLKSSLDAPESLVVTGDEGQLVQVAMNLISNALRYTNAGSVDVRLFLRDRDAVLEVQDSGIGISSEHLPRIFERFYRVDRARSRETGGTGLGLSIVKHIVGAHSGVVEVDSELNGGSTFRVILPAR